MRFTFVVLSQMSAIVFTVRELVYNNNDLSTFHTAASQGQDFNLSSILFYDQIPAKTMTFPSASVCFEFSAY